TSWIQRTPGPIEVGITAQSYEALYAGARGNASGSLEGVYRSPVVAESVIGTRELEPEAVGTPELSATAKAGFIQPASGSGQKVATGSAVVEWPGATINSSIVEVAHGLGTEKFKVALTPIFNEAAGGPLCQVIEKTKTIFKIRAYSVFGSPGKGVQNTIDWTATG